MWRLAFYALLGGVSLNALGTPYLSKASPGTVAVAALLPAAAYLLMFLWWLGRLWPESPWNHIKSAWKDVSLRVADRSFLFVGVTLFFALIAVTKGTIGPFWADPYLAEFDRALFGTDPWKLTHAVLGSLTKPIDYFYGMWPFVITGVTLGITTLADEQRVARYILGLSLSWVFLGMLLAHLLASAGPIFGPDVGFGFNDLRQALDHSAPYSTWARHYLWNARGSIQIGSGISAAPSMHCALTFVMAFTAYRTKWFVPACLYSAFIWIGSVHLGWHYFADGLISLVGVSVIFAALRFHRERNHAVTGSRVPGDGGSVLALRSRRRGAQR